MTPPANPWLTRPAPGGASARPSAVPSPAEHPVLPAAGAGAPAAAVLGGPGAAVAPLPLPAPRTAGHPDAAGPDGPDEGPAPALLGPQPGIRPPAAGDRLPLVPVAGPAPVWWVGAHGGAGERALARLLPGSGACERGWPSTGGSGDRLPVVLVARSDARGLAAAQRAATQWAAGEAGDVELLGLALVADAPGRLPRPLRQFAALVAGGVPRTWHLPWVEAWRTGEEVHPGTAPREFRRLVRDVSRLLPATAVPPTS